MSEEGKGSHSILAPYSVTAASDDGGGDSGVLAAASVIMLATWICRVAKQRNPKTLTVAQDVSAECVDQCPWVDDYFVGAIGDLSQHRRFELVSLTHVLEHVPQPRAFLAKLAAYVSPGGHIYVTAPFRPAFWRPRHGHRPWLRYEYLHVPAHVSYLSKR